MMFSHSTYPVNRLFYTRTIIFFILTFVVLILTPFPSQSAENKVIFETPGIRELRLTTDKKTGGVEMINAGDAVAGNVKLLVNDNFDFTEASVMLDQILDGSKTDKEKVLKIFDFVCENHGYSPVLPPDETELHDPVKYFCVYGYGICDDHAKLFVRLLRKAGIKARFWVLEGHVVAEAYYDNSWRMFDADIRKYYTLPGENRILSVKEITSNTNQAVDQNGKKMNSWLRGVYSTTENNKAYYRVSGQTGHRCLFDLRPGESVVFYPEGGQGFNGKEIPGKKPPRYANAVFTRTFSGEDLVHEKENQEIFSDLNVKDDAISIRFQSPFVGIRAVIRIVSEGDLNMQCFAGEERLNLKKERRPQSGKYIYSADFLKPFLDHYKLTIRIRSPQFPEQLKNIETLEMKRITQCSRQYCPKLNPGKNSIRLDSNDVKDTGNLKIIIRPHRAENSR